MSLAYFDLTGKAAIVTGSGRGLGRAIALGFAGAGARVVTCSRTLAEAEAVAAEIGAAGGEAFALRADIASRADCESLADAAAERFGRLDVMVCNAAVAILKSAEDTTDDEWDRVIDIDLKGAFNCAVAAARRMTAQGGSAIVMTSSNASMVGFPDLLAYSAAKGGVDQMVRSLAVEWGSQGHPRERLQSGLHRASHDRHGRRARRPLGPTRHRDGDPHGPAGRLEEFVGPAIFLASDAASFVTGVTLAVDGGYCAM